MSREPAPDRSCSDDDQRAYVDTWNIAAAVDRLSVAFPLTARRELLIEAGMTCTRR